MKHSSRTYHEWLSFKEDVIYRAGLALPRMVQVPAETRNDLKMANCWQATGLMKMRNLPPAHKSRWDSWIKPWGWIWFLSGSPSQISGAIHPGR